MPLLRRVALRLSCLIALLAPAAPAAAQATLLQGIAESGCILDPGALVAAGAGDADEIAAAAAFVRLRGLAVTGEDGVERLHPAFCPGAEVPITRRVQAALALTGCVATAADLRAAAPLLGFPARDGIAAMAQLWITGDLAVDATRQGFVATLGGCLPPAIDLSRAAWRFARETLEQATCMMPFDALVEAVAAGTGDAIGTPLLLQRLIDLPESPSIFMRREGDDVVLYSETCNAGARDAALPRDDLQRRMLEALGRHGCVLRLNEQPELQQALGLSDAGFAAMLDMANITGTLAGGPFRYNASPVCDPRPQLTLATPRPREAETVIAPAARVLALRIFRDAGCTISERDLERAAQAIGLPLTASEGEGAIEAMISAGHVLERGRSLTLVPEICARATGARAMVIEAFAENSCVLNPSEVSRAFSDVDGAAAVGQLVAEGVIKFPGGRMVMDEAVCRL